MTPPVPTADLVASAICTVVLKSEQSTVMISSASYTKCISDGHSSDLGMANTAHKQYIT